MRLVLDNHRCQQCSGRRRLEVHHKTYERLGCEKLDDLVTLCQRCHAELHKKPAPQQKRTARRKSRRNPPEHPVFRKKFKSKPKHGQPTALDKFSLRAERDRAQGAVKSRARARAAKTGSGRSPVAQSK